MPFRSLRKNHALPAGAEGLTLEHGEHALAGAVDDNTGASVVATTFRILTFRDGQITFEHPWSDVDAGTFDPDTWTLTITWVDGSRPVQWTFKAQNTRLPEVVHERVQATVVVSSNLGLAGPRRSGRVAIRKDLRTRELWVQTVLGRGTPADDPEVRAAVARVSADLKDKVGL